MRRPVFLVLLVLPLCGCEPVPTWSPPGPPGAPGVSVAPAAGLYQNPVFIAWADPQNVWETVVDVTGDYFKIEREEPVRVIGNTITEGRLETFPKVGATLLEPWDHDSANIDERIESTFQSIRRFARVRVMPAQGGYWVEVVVFKELEDVVRPEMATAGAATFRYDDTLTRVINPIGGPPVHAGWIPQGRDPALEQRIIGHLQWRFSGAH